MSTLYDKHVFLLDFVDELSSISFQFRGKSALPLMYYSKLTGNIPYLPLGSYQPSYQNSKSKLENKINVVGEPIFSLKHV